MMEQSSTSSVLLMSTSIKSARLESAASVGSLTSTKSAPAKAQQAQAIDPTECTHVNLPLNYREEKAAAITSERLTTNGNIE